MWNFLASEEAVRDLCLRVYENLADGGMFLSFQNCLMDAGFAGGRVGNVVYTQVAGGGDRGVQYTLRREGDQETLTLVLTDWKREVYDWSLRTAGFKDIQWHSPIISQEGMDTLGSVFWGEYLRHGLYKGFEARK